MRCHAEFKTIFKQNNQHFHYLYMSANTHKYNQISVIVTTLLPRKKRKIERSAHKYQNINMIR